MSKIIKVLKKIAPLSADDCDKFLNITTTSQLKKGDYWIQSGIKNDKIAFLEEGYLRKFYVTEGNERTDFFYFENDFSADLPSIIDNSSPHASIVAMRKTELTIFSYNDFNELVKQHRLSSIYIVLLLGSPFCAFINEPFFYPANSKRTV